VEGGLGGVFQLVWQSGPRHLALRAAGLASFAGFPDSNGDNGAAEFGLVYGRAHTTSWGHAAWGAGVAAVRLDGCGEAGRQSCGTVGVPLVAEAAVETSVAGLGLQAWVDVNPEAPFGGVALLLQLGWMP